MGFRDVDDLDFGIRASGKLKAFLLIALAVFMSAIGWGILDAPMNMKPILGYLLKAFIGLVFGGIAAFCFHHAVRALRGQPGLPAELTARCLTCGERTPHDLVCPVCGELPQNRAAAFHIPSDGFLGELFAAAIATGVGCLGLFIMIGPYLDGERRWWALIAFFALGLLMFVIGLAGLFGFVALSWNRFKGAKDITFSCHGPDRSTSGSGKIAWGRLVGLQGRGRVMVPLVARGRSEGGYRVSPGDLLLAEAIATFDAAGIIELGDVTAYDWKIGAWAEGRRRRPEAPNVQTGDPSGKTRAKNPEFTRDIQRSVLMMLNGIGLPPVDPEDEDFDDEGRPAPKSASELADAAIVRFLARYLMKSQSLHDFKRKLDADPVHRSQIEIHARVLRDRGIVVSNALVDAVVEALLREDTPRP